MNKIYFILFALVFQGMNAQFDVNAQNNDLWNQASGVMLPKNEAYNKVEGSVLLFDEVGLPGKITTTDGKEYTITGLDYNLKSDQIQVLMSKDSVFSFQSKNIDKVRIANTFFVTRFDSEVNRNVYYEEIAISKNMELLKRYSIKVKEGLLNPLTKQMQTADKFVVTSNYWIFTEGKAKKYKLRKKSLSKLFPKDWDKIESFIKENDLSYKVENDLKKIFTYQNTL